MTEAEWLATKSVSRLIDHRKPDRRKLRLLAAACARRMLAALPEDDAFAALIDAAERYADDPAYRTQAVTARRAVRAAARRISPKADSQPMQAGLRVLIAVTEEALEAHTAAVANSSWVMAHPNAVTRANARATQSEQADLLRCVYGNPFRPVSADPTWLTPTVVPLARAAYEERLLPCGDLEPARLAVLADALEDAGCTAEAVLEHLRSPSPHVRGCWAVDLLLRKG